MKNTIFISIDTDREDPILFAKPTDIAPPETKEETKTMVLTDIICLQQALIALIYMAHDNGYGDQTELITDSINIFNDAIKNTPLDES